MQKKYTYGKKSGVKKIVRLFGFILISLGFVVIAYIFLPVISYYVYLSSAFAQSDYETPLPDRFVIKEEAHITDLFAQSISSITNDYTDAQNWVSQIEYQPEEKNEIEKIEQYTLSIPKLGIEDAEVSAVDTKLSEHLVQYFTTSNNPIENGTSVIFGHSTLPQLFKEGDYRTIFANVHTLKTDDVFFIDIEGKEYKYKIFSISILSSDDPNIFSQAFDNSYITLVSCTPPGTVWKRLVIRASLVS